MWSQRASGLTDRAAATAAAGALVGYMAELVGRKRRAPGEDVLSDLLTASANDPPQAGRGATSSSR